MSRSITSMVRVCAAAAAMAAVSAVALAGDGDAVPLSPGKGLPLDIGNKHAMTYYVEKDGACSVTMVLASVDGGVTGEDSPGTRISAMVAPGTAVRVDTSSSKSAEFFCGPAGSKMTARVFERESYTKAKKS